MLVAGQYTLRGGLTGQGQQSPVVQGGESSGSLGVVVGGRGPVPGGSGPTSVLAWRKLRSLTAGTSGT